MLVMLQTAAQPLCCVLCVYNRIYRVVCAIFAVILVAFACYLIYLFI